MKINIRNGVILGVMALVAFGLKKFYQTASVHDLYWILAPSKLVVQGFTGLEFGYDAALGYVNQAHQFVIAKSCAGVNFLIIVFCTSVFGFSLKMKPNHWQWVSVPAFLGIAYLLTVVVNAFRIISALLLKGAHLPQVFGLDPNQLHALEGVVVYLAFLLLYYLLLNYFFTHHRSPKVAASADI